MEYLTPNRYRAMGFGSDLSDVAPIELRSTIARATADVNSLCSVPRLPQMHDFRGGTITLEEHAWYIDQYERPHPFQSWPFHGPITEVDRFAIYATNSIYVEISPANIFINNSAGYIEISSLNLTQFGIFGAGIVPLLGIYNPVVRLNYKYGRKFPVIEEFAEPFDAQTYVLQNQFWTDDAVTVKVAGSVVTSGFTIDRKEGQIVFNVNQPADTEVLVSYTYSLPNEIQQATGLLVAKQLEATGLRADGMGGLEALQVQEVSMRRIGAGSRMSGNAVQDSPSDEVLRLLRDYMFYTIR